MDYGERERNEGQCLRMKLEREEGQCLRMKPERERGTKKMILHRRLKIKERLFLLLVKPTEQRRQHSSSSPRDLNFKHLNSQVRHVSFFIKIQFEARNWRLRRGSSFSWSKLQRDSLKLESHEDSVLPLSKKP